MDLGVGCSTADDYGVTPKARTEEDECSSATLSSSRDLASSYDTE